MYTTSGFSSKAETDTCRQFKARQSRLEQGWLRSEFVTCKLKVSRVTAYGWDLILLECLSDYSTDPNTGESLWEAGKPWNHHQMWCLLKVKRWMAQSPKPTLDDLRSHLSSNQHLYSHAQFFKETFKYDTQGTSKNA